jgi:serine protease
LTVNDGHGGSNSKSSTVVIGTGGDPDPATPTITSGANNSVTLSGAGNEKFYKIAVPSGTGQLQVVMTGPACGALGLNCSVDGDLYTNPAARPTDTVYACRPFVNGNNETCTHASPQSGYWYIRVKSAKGAGTVNIRATVS